MVRVGADMLRFFQKDEPLVQRFAPADLPRRKLEETLLREPERVDAKTAHGREIVLRDERVELFSEHGLHSFGKSCRQIHIIRQFSTSRVLFSVNWVV